MWALDLLLCGFAACKLYEAEEGRRRTALQQQAWQHANGFCSHFLITLSLFTPCLRVKRCARYKKRTPLVRLDQGELVTYIGTAQPKDHILRNIGGVVGGALQIARH